MSCDVVGYVYQLPYIDMCICDLFICFGVSRCCLLEANANGNGKIPPYVFCDLGTVSIGLVIMQANKRGVLRGLRDVKQTHALWLGI